MVRNLLKWSTLVIAIFGGTLAFGTMIQQMNLGEMTGNAERIIRGTITSIETGSVEAGGANLPTITYVVQVVEVLKGSTATDDNQIRVTMYGSLKAKRGDGNLRLADTFQGPKLRSGMEYLLFLTQPSRIGLSMTVGVGQGSFHFLSDGTVMNEAKNNGLFREMDSQGLPSSGPIDYDFLASRIQQLVSK